MTDKRPIGELLEDTAALTQAFQLAVRAQVERHRRLGNPIAIWADGKVRLVCGENMDEISAGQSPEEPGEGLRKLA